MKKLNMKNLKKILFILVIFMFVGIGKISFADENNVYVIPIKGDINRATSSFVKSNIDDINKVGAKAIIFEIDTYGGLIDEAIKIKDAIVSTNIPTISYINNKAESAGVLISIASEKVVMAPNATIGSAETIPNEEKALSMWRAVLRDTAQLRGRNEEVIEAMADKDIAITGLIDKGKLVNLTTNEAVKYEIADYTATNYDDILEKLGSENASIVEKQEGIQMKFAKYISNPYISSLLLTMGFIGLVIEILTPGFGLGGTASVIGFGLYFGGNMLAGNSNWTSLSLFVIGLILLIIEVIVPGFGLPGISGILFVAIGIILAANSVGVALLSMSIAIIITTIVTVVLVKFGYKSKLLNSIVLKTEHKGDKGYLSSDSKTVLLNKEGITLSGLRPSGYVDIDGEKIDVLSDEGFISKDTRVKIVRIEGSKTFVRRI